MPRSALPVCWTWPASCWASRMLARARGLSFVVSVVTLAFALSFLGSTCDLAADECEEPAGNQCTSDNVAVTCRRPGAESHRVESRETCANDRICTMGVGHYPFCARRNDACSGAADSRCANNVISMCRQTEAGGFVWSDQTCAATLKCSTEGRLDCVLR